MDRRAFLQLGLPMPLVNKLSFAAAKAKDEDQTLATSAAVSALILKDEAASVPKVAVQQKSLDNKVAAAPTEPKKAKIEESVEEGAADASLWTPQQVVSWAKEAALPEFTQAKLANVSGAVLVNLSGAEMNQFVESPMDKVGCV